MGALETPCFSSLDVLLIRFESSTFSSMEGNGRRINTSTEDAQFRIAICLGIYSEWPLTPLTFIGCGLMMREPRIRVFWVDQPPESHHTTSTAKDDSLPQQTTSPNFLIQQYVSIWRFPKWGYPQSSSISRWDLPWHKPSSYWGSPMTMETPIWSSWIHILSAGIVFSWFNVHQFINFPCKKNQIFFIGQWFFQSSTKCLKAWIEIICIRPRTELLQ